MDKDTRNRIQHATQAARVLLEHEYAEQLEGVFDIRLDGTIAAEPGEHLDAGHRVLRTKLVTAVEHQRATGMKKADAVAAHIREAAFTTLNRFVALKMLEARELVQECISHSDQSAGFKEFTGLAPGLVQLPDHGYRIYIESLFDEIGRDVRVLFDRRDPASLLWPRRQALLDLLGVLNQADLAAVWAEDETIGWVYQYFNSDDERKQMRTESQAPRNSRELAVRNQFFTPRYVVQFLTDNTLGRIWYEMRQGDTRLGDLDYLVCRPNEVFLAEGEAAPADADADDEKRTQEDSLKRPVHVPFRAKRDPRDIRVLDPACGSGHFLLYTFELLLTIYQEAWADKTSPASEATGRTLRDDYPNSDELRAATPGLILRYNLHGIDIDPRCTQIAALALWMRAQRAFSDQGIARDARPAIQMTNIVVAESMPGDPELRREFIATLEPNLGELVHRVFERMELAGEAGSLLRVEAEIERAVREIYGEHGDLFRSEDEERWNRVAKELRQALQIYAERANHGREYQRRLFAEDAVRGLGFIDLCGHRYDVVLMNPPFGEVSLGARDHLYETLPESSRDILAAFVRRFVARLKQGGALGCISNRLVLTNEHLRTWRTDLLLGNETYLFALADLGYGVLDAVVETAAYVVTRQAHKTASVVECLGTRDKESAILDALRGRAGGGRAWFPELATQRNTPASRFMYDLPPHWLQRLRDSSGHNLFSGRGGICTGDDFRYYRTFWEAEPVIEKRGFLWLAKGGEFSRYRTNTHLVVDWSMREWLLRTKNRDLYGSPGATYTYRTTSNLSSRVLNRGVCFSQGGPGLVARESFLAPVVVFLSNSFVASFVLERMVGGGDYSVKGSAARNLEPRYIEFIPDFPVSESAAHWFGEKLAQLISILDDIEDDEAHPHFSCPPIGPGEPIERSVLHHVRRGFSRLAIAYSIVRETEHLIARAVGFDLQDQAICYPDTGWPLPESEDVSPEAEQLASRVDLMPRDSVQISEFEGWSDGQPRFRNKLAHYLHASVEAIAHTCSVAPEKICEELGRSAVPSPKYLSRYSSNTLSFLLGSALGRWNYAKSTACEQPMPGCFEELPERAIGALECVHPEQAAHSTSAPHAAAVLVDDPGHPDDMVTACNRIARDLWKEHSAENLSKLFAWAGISRDARDWFRDRAFADHLARYSKSRRKSPIYWQLGTPSRSYSVWLYYHRFTADTFYRVVSDYVTPKLTYEERNLTNLTQDAGHDPSSGQRKEMEAQEMFAAELRAFRDELARIAPLWNPDLKDGVIINFAPLWRLVPHHGAWQKECKATWDRLCKGDYDWAHLAMHLWPERVVPKCAEDQSLAIAHGLQDVFWYENSVGKWEPRKVDQLELDKLVKERTSAAVKEALKSLLQAPSPATVRSSRKKAPQTKETRKRTASPGPKATTNGAPSRGRSSATADPELLIMVKEAIAANSDGASKATVIDTTGITSVEWSTVIKAILADGSVTQTGERRGARYHLAGGDA